MLKGFVEKHYKNIESVLILPSSTHEVILVPMNQGSYSKKELVDMVSEINDTQVAREEVLSNSVYIYSVKANEITILGEDIINE